jgi:uncharacterized protein HemX
MFRTLTALFKAAPVFWLLLLLGAVAYGYYYFDSLVDAKQRAQYIEEKQKLEKTIKTLEEQTEQARQEAFSLSEDNRQLQNDIETLTKQSAQLKKQYQSSRSAVDKQSTPVTIKVDGNKVIPDHSIPSTDSLCKRSESIGIPCPNTKSTN